MYRRRVSFVISHAPPAALCLVPCCCSMAAAAPSEDDVEIFKDVSDDDRQKTEEENSTDVGPKAKRARAKGKAKAKGQAETDDTEEPQSRSASKAGGKGTGGGKGGNHGGGRKSKVTAGFKKCNCCQRVLPISSFPVGSGACIDDKQAMENMRNQAKAQSQISWFEEQIKTDQGRMKLVEQYSYFILLTYPMHYTFLSRASLL